MLTLGITGVLKVLNPISKQIALIGNYQMLYSVFGQSEETDKTQMQTA